MRTEIRAPDLGDFGDVPIIEILVAEGDVPTVEQALITVKSGKAAMDIPSPVASRIISFAVELSP